jgi:hypothetical protein
MVQRLLAGKFVFHKEGSMQKQTRPKKRTSKTNARRTKAAPAVKKKRSNTKRRKTVLGRLRNAFDETAAKIKNLLPGESKDQNRDGNEMA